MTGSHFFHPLQSSTFTFLLFIWFCLASVKWIPFMLWQTLEHSYQESEPYHLHSEVSRLLGQNAWNRPAWPQDAMAAVKSLKIKYRFYEDGKQHEKLESLLLSLRFHLLKSTWVILTYFYHFILFIQKTSKPGTCFHFSHLPVLISQASNVS